jgi:hypothetical protein
MTKYMQAHLKFIAYIRNESLLRFFARLCKIANPHFSRLKPSSSLVMPNLIFASK